MSNGEVQAKFSIGMGVVDDGTFVEFEKRMKSLEAQAQTIGANLARGMAAQGPMKSIKDQAGASLKFVGDEMRLQLSFADQNLGVTTERLTNLSTAARAAAGQFEVLKTSSQRAFQKMSGGASWAVKQMLKLKAELQQLATLMAAIEKHSAALAKVGTKGPAVVADPTSQILTKQAKFRVWQTGAGGRITNEFFEQRKFVGTFEQINAQQQKFLQGLTSQGLKHQEVFIRNGRYGTWNYNQLYTGCEYSLGTVGGFSCVLYAGRLRHGRGWFYTGKEHLQYFDEELSGFLHGFARILSDRLCFDVRRRERICRAKRLVSFWIGPGG